MKQAKLIFTIIFSSHPISHITPIKWKKNNKDFENRDEKLLHEHMVSSSKFNPSRISKESIESSIITTNRLVEVYL